MNEPNLSLQIAAGILIAMGIIYLFRLAFTLWNDRDSRGLSLALFMFTGLIGGGLILAGFDPAWW